MEHTLTKLKLCTNCVQYVYCTPQAVVLISNNHGNSSMATTMLATRRLRVMTWNVNGLRAVLQREKQKLQTLLRDLDADIVCFQETKLTRSELDDELVRPEGAAHDAHVCAQAAHLRVASLTHTLATLMHKL